MVLKTGQAEAFEPLKWATPFLSDPDWCNGQRYRGAGNGENYDIFCRDTMSTHDGVRHWLELYKKPKPGSKIVAKSLSLCSFGSGLNGFPKTCHGGAVMSMMDEALAFCMIANQAEAIGMHTDEGMDMGAETWREQLAEGKPIGEALEGRMVTAHMDLKFLKPVPCPGVVGIEVILLEDKGHKMKIRGLMKDGNGTPLVQADGVWVKLGGGAKL